MRTRIRELRKVKKLSQVELAEAVGCRRETIGNLESGRYNPSVQMAHDIAVVLGTTMDELFIFEEED